MSPFGSGPLIWSYASFRTRHSQVLEIATRRGLAQGQLEYFCYALELLVNAASAGVSPGGSHLHPGNRPAFAAEGRWKEMASARVREWVDWENREASSASGVSNVLGPAAL